jgi:hypothetical protein
MYLLTKVIFTTLEFSAMILLCLSLFRIYFRYSLHKVVFIAFSLSVISVYIRDILHEPAFAALPVIITEIVLITVLFGLPLIFSFLVCVIGAIATVTVESLVVTIGSYFNLFTQEMLKTSSLQFIYHELIATAFLLLLVYPLQRYKLGFHTTSNDALKGYNFLLSAVLVIAIVAIQIQVIAFQKSAIHIFIPVILGLIFLTGIYLAYKHNKMLWKNRRERLSKR